MKIEHFAFQVNDTIAVANWYCKHFGFSVKKAVDQPFPVRFLADESRDVMIEIYSNPTVKTPDYYNMHPLILHVAFVCPNVDETTKRLITAGATLVSGPDLLPNGDQLAMLRDPWGLAIQLCFRMQAMV